MKTSGAYLRKLKRLACKEKLHNRAMKGVAAPQAKRMESSEPRVEWRGRLEHSITFHDRLAGVIHTLDLSRGKRRDQFDARVDGKPWKTGVSATVIVKFVRLKLKPHIARL